MNRNRKVVIDEETIAFRKKVGEKIKEEREHFFEHCDIGLMLDILEKRKRKRSYDGLSQSEFADILSLTEDQVYNLEMGRGELRYEYLHKISKVCKCDIGYLLGECKYRTYTTTDICEETGLTPTSADSLKKLKDITGVTRTEEETDIFLKLLEKIITSYTDSEADWLTLGEGMVFDDDFPILNLVEYVLKVRELKRLPDKPLLNALNDVAVSGELKEIMVGEKKVPDNIVNLLTERDLKEDDFFRIYFDYTNRDRFLRSDLKMIRFTIQEDMTRFLHSIYKEGEINGK